MITRLGKQRIASHLGTANPGKPIITHSALSDHMGEINENDLVVAGEDLRIVLATSVDNVTVLGEDTVVAIEITEEDYTLRKVGFLDALSGGNLICVHKLYNSIALTGYQKLHIVHGLVIV